MPFACRPTLAGTCGVFPWHVLILKLLHGSCPRHIRTSWVSWGLNCNVPGQCSVFVLFFGIDPKLVFFFEQPCVLFKLKLKMLKMESDHSLHMAICNRKRESLISKNLKHRPQTYCKSFGVKNVIQQKRFAWRSQYLFQMAQMVPL